MAREVMAINQKAQTINKNEQKRTESCQKKYNCKSLCLKE